MPQPRQTLKEIYLSMRPAVSHGQTAPGTIDLYERPKVPNPDGGISTVYSMSFTDEDPQSPRYGLEILVPRADEGRILTEAEAMQKYYQTGQHMGAFNTPEEANAAAEAIHNDYARGKYDMRPAVSHQRTR